MAARFVRDAIVRPMRCACIPFLGNQQERAGFFTFDTDLYGEHVYVSWTAFQEMCAVANYVPATQGLSVSTQREMDSLREQLEEAQRGRAEAEKQLEAFGTLKAAGLVAA